MDAAELFLTCAVVLSCGNEGLVNRMLLGVPGSVELHSHCQGWNMLWGEPHICAGYHAVRRKEPLPAEVCPSTIENIFELGRNRWEISLIMIRMS